MDIAISQIQERKAVMGEPRPISKIPALLEAKGWDRAKFLGRCIEWGIGIDTAKRLYDGEPNTTTKTLKILATMLEVEIGDLVG